ncbi:MAG: DNA repair protein RadC [Treponema sp.]|nr:DNA repair protein RadC [Treponema sp.]
MQENEIFNSTDDVPDTPYRDPVVGDIFALPISERPRERLIEKGPRALPDQELMAIVLNHGIKGKGAGIMAAELLARIDGSRNFPTVRELLRINGFGVSRACMIVAMYELGRRYWDFSGVKIRCPADLYNVVSHYASRKYELFLSVSLNGTHEVIAVRVVTQGVINRTIVHPREVFADAITDRCTAVCVCHNHPSGDLFPSREDDAVTVSLAAAAEILGINFLDHIIFSDKNFYSYRKENRLRENEKSSWSCADGTGNYRAPEPFSKLG